jgi:hypothetical protein
MQHLLAGDRKINTVAQSLLDAVDQGIPADAFLSLEIVRAS